VTGGILAVVLLALLGAPLFAVLAALTFLLYRAEGIDFGSIAVEMYRLAENPLLIAIPMFTFAGYLLAESQAPRRLVTVSRALLGWMPGGLAIVSLVACAVFTAFTGASGVTIIAVGGLLLPALLAERYSPRFAHGLLTTSGSLGLLFPPSLPIILFGFVAGVSIDKLFAAGAIPGILLLVLLGSYAARASFVARVPRQRFSWSALRSAARAAAWEIPLPIVVVAGIYSGKVTVTEAASLTAVYALFVEVFVYRDVKLRALPRVLTESMVLVGGILIILAVALALTNYFIAAEIPTRIFGWIQNYVHSRAVFLVLLNIFLLIVGCLMDIFSATLVVVPLIAPVAEAYGVDLVHLGIIFLTNLEIGYSTPPVGLNLFIASLRFERPIVDLYRASLPFLGLYLMALLLITYVPALSLWLVQVLGVR
jgi:tripartite ATP-independent transporter DctM subunit